MTIFEDENFENTMKTIVEPWVNTTVRDGFMTTSDGVSLHYRYAIPENAKAAIIIVHGFCEFYGKYRELSYRVYDAGYAFFFLEQRGYGLSHRDVENKDLVYIDSFDTHVSDLREFYDKVVCAEAPDLQKFILAHSMGGAVSSLFLEKYPDEIKAAVLASPLIEMNLHGIPEPAAIILFDLGHVAHKDKCDIPGRKGFISDENFKGSAMLSEVRYLYTFRQRLADGNYRTFDPTFGWTNAAIKATHKLQKGLPEIKADILLMTAKYEDRVNPDGFKIMMKRTPHIREVHFPTSKHEIFHSIADDRVRFYEEVFGFFGEHLK